MNSTLPEALLSYFSEFVAAQMGLYFQPERWRDFENGINSAAKVFNFKNAESCIQWLTSSSLTKYQIEVLASHLTVGETYFFREKESFEILKERIFPELINSCQKTGKKMVVWSAGCCTGEEAYSLAILLSEIIPNLNPQNVTILATDINPNFLKKALNGVYSEWSFRRTPLWVKERYFNKNRDGNFEILPNIKKLVTFSYLNLADSVYSSLLTDKTVDIILCRNVLMYFGPEQIKKVIQNIYFSLTDEGWLAVSPSELSHTLFEQFTSIDFTGSIFYKKDSKKQKHQLTEAILYKKEIEIENFFLPQLDVYNIINLELPGSFSLETVEKIAPKDEKQTATELEKSPYVEALSLYEHGLYENTVEKLSKLIYSDKNNPEVFTLLARACANQGKHDEAIKWCQKAIAINKLNAEYYYLLAIILQEQDQVEEAIESLKRVIYIDQNFVLAHFALGTLTLGQGNLKESNKYFEIGLSLLSTYNPEEILPHSEGVMAGRLIETIRSMSCNQK